MSRYKVKRKLVVDKTEVCCIICEKIFQGAKSLNSHYAQLHLLRDSEQKKKRGRPEGIAAWNKGLTKDTDDRVKKNAESVSKTTQIKIKNGTYIPSVMGEEARTSLSISQSLNNRGGKSKWFTVAGQRVQGTWERDFAEFCESNNIEWVKLKTNKDVWFYTVDGAKKAYTPDFYLPEFDSFIEIKGYWWGKDKEKMKRVLEENIHKEICIFRKSEMDILRSSGVSGLRDCLKNSRIRFDSEGFHQILG